MFSAIIARQKLTQSIVKTENRSKGEEANPLIIFTKGPDRLLHATT